MGCADLFCLRWLIALLIATLTQHARTPAREWQTPEVAAAADAYNRQKSQHHYGGLLRRTRDAELHTI